MLGHDEIAPLLPHSGKMVLLDVVQSWTDSEINCLARSHRDAGNPLRRDGLLPAICGVEYGAQAMAVHGALVSGGKGRPGVLAGLRNITCHVDRLDNVAGDLTVHAKLVIGERRSAMYAFSIRSADVPLVDGQATVFLT